MAYRRNGEPVRLRRKHRSAFSLADALLFAAAAGIDAPDGGGAKKARGCFSGRKVLERLGGRTRARTWDPMIKSHLLYQLSYAPGSWSGEALQEGVV
jgi:hypothetical protein